MEQSRGVAEGVGKYRRFGKGEPVLILSNPQANPDWWAAEIVALLVDAGFEAITFIHEGSNYEPKGVVDDVKRLIDGLGLDGVRLLGWSQGAVIAQETALAHPGIIRSAVLIATYGRQNYMDKVLQDAWDVLAAGGEELDSVRLAMGLLTSHPPALLGSDTFVDPLISAQADWASKRSTSVEARTRSATFIRSYQERLGPLSKMTVPCLVVGFGQDADTYQVRAMEVAAAIPSSRYIEFPDAGHLEPVTRPKDVMAPVLQFFTCETGPKKQSFLRAAEVADIPVICRFGEDHIRAHYAPLIGAEAADGQVRSWWNAVTIRAAVAEGLVVVAEQGRTLTGVGQRGRRGTDHVIYKLYVHPEYRGQGLGHRLLDALIKELPVNARRLYIEHFISNKRAGVFYEREGFSVERTEESPTGVRALSVVWRSRDIDPQR